MNEHADDPWPAQREISDPAAVDLLADLRALRYLTPFLGAAHTLTSAAQALDRSTSTLAYWIPRFVRVGLLVHLGDVRRNGMAMPRYRAPADQLVVPFKSVPFDRRVALLDGGRMRILRRFLDGLDEAIERDEAFALGFSSEAPHRFAIEMVESPAHRADRPYTDGWLTMALTTDDARAFSHELGELLDRFKERSSGRRAGTRRHIIHVGIAPDARVRWRSVDDDLAPE